MAYKAAGITIEWAGEDVAERGICRDSRRVLVEVSPEFYRPAEVESLIGDPTKAWRALGWRPSTTVRNSARRWSMRILPGIATGV